MVEQNAKVWKMKLNQQKEEEINSIVNEENNLALNAQE